MKIEGVEVRSTSFGFGVKRLELRAQGLVGAQMCIKNRDNEGLGIRVWGLGFGVCDFGSGISGLGFRLWGLGYRVYGSRIRRSTGLRN